MICRVDGLADVVEQPREPEHRVGLQPLDDRERVPEHVLVPMHRVLLELQRRQLGQELVRQPRLDQQGEPGAGRSRDEQLVELVADPLRRHDPQAFRASRAIASTTRGAGVTPSWATNRAARSIRSGSSVNAISGSSGVSRRLRRQVLHPFERIDELTVGQPHRHRVDREVAAGEVGLDVLRERDRRLAFVLRRSAPRGTS